MDASVTLKVWFTPQKFTKILNLHKVPFSVKHKRRYFEECNQTVSGPQGFYFFSIAVTEDQKLFSYPHSSKYLLLCSTEEINYYRFGTTCECVGLNDDKILIFG